MIDVHTETVGAITPDAATQFRNLTTTLSGYTSEPTGTLHNPYDSTPVRPDNLHYLGRGRNIAQDGQVFGVYIRGVVTPPSMLAEAQDHPEQLTHEVHVNFDTMPLSRVHRNLGILSLGLHLDGNFSVVTYRLPEAGGHQPKTLLAPFGKWMTSAALQEAEVSRAAKAEGHLPNRIPLQPTPDDIAPLVQFAKDPANKDTFFFFHGTPGGLAEGIVLAR